MPQSPTYRGRDAVTFAKAAIDDLIAAAWKGQCSPISIQAWRHLGDSRLLQVRARGWKWMKIGWPQEMRVNMAGGKPLLRESAPEGR